MLRAMRRAHPVALLLAAACLGLMLLYSGCTWLLDTFVSDSATRLSFQIRDEAYALRHSGAKTRTFTHVPRAWPDGLTGDYRVEFPGTDVADGQRPLMTAKSYDGPLWSSTTYHLNFVRVPQPLKVAHRKGEPTLVTLELRGDTVYVTALK